MTDIAIVNRSTIVGDAVIAAMLPSLQTQITRDFAPFWQADATLHFCGSTEQPDPSHWPLYVLDHSDQSNDLGYHVDTDGTPSAKVFAADDARYGIALSVTISHELLELLADPQASKTVEIAGAAQILEVCDPCQSDSDAYSIGGTKVSNFATPLWFGMDDRGAPGRYDFRALLSGPCPTLGPGGYRMFYSAGGGWQTTMARHVDGSLPYRALRPHGRSARRARKPIA